MPHDIASTRRVVSTLGVDSPSPRIVCRWWMELWAAWGIAFAQPLLNLLGGSTDFFLSFKLTPSDVRVFVIAFVVIPPLVGLLVEVLVMRYVAIRAWVHYSLIGICVLATIGQVVKVSAGIDGIPYVVIAVVASIGVLSAYLTWASIRDWFAWIAVVPVLAVALFFFSTPSGRYARAEASKGGNETSATSNGFDFPIFMLMLDEFPLQSILDGEGGIDDTRFPNFQRLLEGSTWYRNYSTTSELTGFAIPSMLSGINPKKGMSPTYVDHPNSLFSLVANNHDMHVSETITQLCSPQVCTSSPDNSNGSATTSRDWSGFLHGLVSVMTQRLDTTRANEVDIFAGPNGGANNDTGVETSTSPLQPSESPSNLRLVASAQVDRLNSWIDQLPTTSEVTASGKYPFHYIHVLLPHQKWIYLPDGTKYPSYGPEWNQAETEWQVRVREQRHLLQVQYLDTLIGRFLDKLESADLYSKSMVIVAADHGISFMNGYHRRFAGGDLANATQLMHVPLFIHLPGELGGAVNDTNVENIDVLPLIASKLDVSIPWKVDGVNPGEKSGAQEETKTFYFMGKPLGGPPRSGTNMTVPMTQFARESMTWGFRANESGSPTSMLDWLYSSSPFSALRGTDVESQTVRDGSLEFSFTDTRSLKDRPVVVDGTIRGAVRSTDWYAFAIDGTILGLSPSSASGAATPVTALLNTKATSPAGLTIYRIIDPQTLERVEISAK